MQTEVIPKCRICLETLEEYIDMESSFYSDQTQVNLTYMDCFRQCTHLNVEINGDVTQGICVPCSLDLRFAYEFLRKAQDAAQFYEEYAYNFCDELQIIPIECDALSCSQPTLKETEMILESEMMVESEKVELDDALSEPEESQIPKTESEDNIVILELEHLQSNGDNDLSDTDNTLEVIAMDNEENNVDPLNEYENEQEQGISTIFEDFNYKKTKNTKRPRKTKTCRDRSNNSRESSRTCKICQNNLDDLNLSEHMEMYHMHIEKCPHCEYEDKEFKVREHEKLKHANIDKYLCDICSKTYLKLGALNTHLKWHARKQSNFQSKNCKICGKSYSTKFSLQQHLVTHKNERKYYECDQCDKWYLYKSSWNDHIKMHKGETLKCLECDKQFSQQYRLNVHMRFHTGVLPYSCEVCGQMFAIKSHLRSHMWRHQGLKLQCEDCPKLFTSSRALREHSFTHTRMPFPCCYCPKAYPSTNKYRGHLKTAHSIELNEEELQKVREKIGPIAKKLLLRKKLRLVQADSVMKKAEVKTEYVEHFSVELC